MDIIDELIEQENINFSNGSGSRELEKFIRCVDHNYENLAAFFNDNAGACEAVVEWVRKQNLPDWNENIESHLNEVDEDEEEQ